MKTADVNFPYQKFVTVWQKAESVHDAAKEMSIHPRVASVKATFLRSRGVALKRFPRGKSIDYAGLKKLAETTKK